MKKSLAIILGLLACACVALCISYSKKKSLVEYADPTVGGVSFMLETTRQTIHLPNEMLRFMPLRSSMLDDWIHDFALQMPNHRRHWVFGIMPFCTDSPENVWTAPGVCDNEETHPHYYRAQLDGVNLEFSPSCRSGIVRLTYSGEGKRLVRFRTRTARGEYASEGSRIVTSTSDFGPSEDGQWMRAYLYAEFDRDLSDALYQGENKKQMMLTVPGEGREVKMRYGISYISLDQARENMEREIPDFDFDRVKKNAEKVWNERLGQIEVSGGTESHKRSFYTALYRCSERMVNINEYGRYYNAWDHKVHETETPFYVDNWLWDTHIALEPLHIILNPEMEVDKLNSFAEMYKAGGIMPRFALANGNWTAMAGNFVAVWMADAWAKGLRFNLEEAYEGLRKNSLERTLLPWHAGPAVSIDSFYTEHGYYPAVRLEDPEPVPEVDQNWERRQSVSITTANSYCDWCIAKLAKVLGKQDDEQLFLKRAANYRNVFREDAGMMWPKNAQGEWIEPYHPNTDGRIYYTENNAYIFNWDVKQDFSGLIQLMGGRKKAETKLDELFHMGIGTQRWKFYNSLPDATGLMGMFQMGNEPSFHIPYLYNYVGAPWKTQKYLHTLIDTYFTDTHLGMPGDEDGGGMSAFVVFTMMGFFPVTPGTTNYVIGSPFFETTTMHLPDGKTFTVKAKNFSEENKFIQSVRLNGKAYTHTWITHEDLLAGGTLELTMGCQPNKAWGAAPEDAPPSDINDL
ncbi:MAG: glycoside hydrolase family 92 protein [Bacteroidaceae bacterium]|nr:glycoside hydrolase family 92 protein [Bacteroidaceae bacterium]